MLSCNSNLGGNLGKWWHYRHKTSKCSVKHKLLFSHLSCVSCLLAWMQTVACLNALRSDDEYTPCDLPKVLWGKPYLYYPECSSSELDCFSSFLPSESGPSETAPGPGGLHMWEPVRRSDEDSSPLVKAVEAPSCTEPTESSWILRTLHRVTFSSNYLDLCVHRGFETVGRRYLYAPPSDISGYVDEGFPPRSQIHPDKCEPEVSSPCVTTCCTAAVSKHTYSWNLMQHAEAFNSNLNYSL